MMDAIKTYRQGDKVLKIFQDEDPEDPREWDNMGKMVLFHKRYTLSNELKLDSDDYEGWDELAYKLRVEHGARLLIPVYMLDHSGIRIKAGSFNDPWDSGQIGFIIATDEDIRECFMVKRITKAIEKRAYDNLLGEVETYDKYVSGQVYGYTISTEKTCDLGHKHEEVDDSCWGFYDVDEIVAEVGEGFVEVD